MKKDRVKRNAEICGKCAHLIITCILSLRLKRCGQCGCLVAMRIRGNCPIGKF